MSLGPEQGADLDGECAEDQRPNSGLREGEISHAEVNDALRLASKTIIFGQQNRLRNGLVLDADERLPRFHAGHDLVKFFYGGIRQLPDYLLDAMLAAGISVTLVKGCELLVFHDVRCHQSLHVGRVRKTIYISDKLLQGAFEKGYDYWALAELLIQEAYPLLDYLLIVELARRCQSQLHKRLTLSYYFIKDTLRRLNKHRRELDETEDNEFAHFFCHYAEEFYSWDGKICDQDPFELAAAIFDEERERLWASNKIYTIRAALKYPDYFDLDRDIVHPLAHARAAELGQSTAPRNVAEMIHDLEDAARFKVSRQIKTDRLLEQLLQCGAAGIRGLVECLARAAATGRTLLTDNQYDGYDIVVEWKRKLQKYSSSPLEGLPDSISNDWNQLFYERYLHYLMREFHRFQRLPQEDREEHLDYLESLLHLIIGCTRPQATGPERMALVATAAHASARAKVAQWTNTAEFLLADRDVSEGADLVLALLEKLDLHPLFHTLLLGQARDLSGAAPLSFGLPTRDLLAQLLEKMPPRPYRLSSDPQTVRARLNRFDQRRRKAPDDADLVVLLAAVFLRLDQAPNYAEYIGYVRALDRRAAPALDEILQGIQPQDQRRRRIRDQAGMLRRGLARAPGGAASA